MAFSIADCLSLANDIDKFVSSERANELAAKLALAGFTSIREVRTGFPADDPERTEMAAGLVRELLPGASDSEDLSGLLGAVAHRAVRLSVSSLNAPLLRGEFLVPKRSLMGHMVEVRVSSGVAEA